MRHIQWCVAICRHHGLVDDDTLRAAGFKPVGKVTEQTATRAEAA
jgi:hypothetical protein